VLLSLDALHRLAKAVITENDAAIANVGDDMALILKVRAASGR
jgi:hypothetical protein